MRFLSFTAKLFFTVNVMQPGTAFVAKSTLPRSAMGLRFLWKPSNDFGSNFKSWRSSRNYVQSFATSSPTLETCDSSSSALYSTSPLRPLVVCGPSGVGKGTIISKFMDARLAKENQLAVLPKFGFTVSHTSRQPREHEIDGVHYHFCSREFMMEKINSGDFFIEHAEVHGNLYGTSFKAISDVSRVASINPTFDPPLIETQCLLDVDVQGVRSIKNFQSKQQNMKLEQIKLGKERSTQQYILSTIESLPEIKANFIFIAPPSISSLRERLVTRGTETPETLERRFQNAKAELEYGMEPGNFDAIIVNDDLVQACNEFEKVVKDMYSNETTGTSARAFN